MPVNPGPLSVSTVRFSATPDYRDHPPCDVRPRENDGGRQRDGSRTAFGQLGDSVDAVGDRIDVMMDGEVQRGTHVLKALSLGATAVGVGRLYL